jgi:hypothetical protein
LSRQLRCRPALAQVPLLLQRDRRQREKQCAAQLCRQQTWEQPERNHWRAAWILALLPE